MFYVANEKESNSGKWKDWIVFAGVLLVLLFATYSCIYGPPVDPPTHMKSSDSYWYSGK